MRSEQALAEVELISGNKKLRIKALVDTGASRNVISKQLAQELGALTPLEKPYTLRTADRKGELKIVGYSNPQIIFQGVEVPGGERFEVAENLREDIQLVIGRPAIDSWDIIFTPEGPRPRRTPIEFEMV